MMLLQGHIRMEQARGEYADHAYFTVITRRHRVRDADKHGAGKTDWTDLARTRTARLPNNPAEERWDGQKRAWTICSDRHSQSQKIGPWRICKQVREGAWASQTGSKQQWD